MDPVHPRPLLASGRDLPHGIRPAKGAMVDPEHRPIPAPDGEQQSGCQRPPRKSHSKSQRWPSSGDSQPRQATVYAVQPLSELSPVTPGDVREVTGGQGVAGSNPAVPTGNDTFSNTLLPPSEPTKEWPGAGTAFLSHPGRKLSTQASGRFGGPRVSRL